MTKVNPHYSKLQSGYLFPEIGRRVKKYSEENPNKKVIKLGIGDVTQPLSPCIVNAMDKALQEMASPSSFKGYGPEQGYEFLRKAIQSDYKKKNVDIELDEIFVSDGSKCDSGNIQEIFSVLSKVAVTDPVYPVYVDTNVMAGRTGNITEKGHYEGLSYLPSTAENSFKPPFPNKETDLVYLCSPNNPTGTVMTKSDLEQWVNWAKENNAIILFDGAYEAFIQDPTLPRSIFEIPGAKEVAIEFRSFSKNAGFTGVRCAYTVVPKELFGKGENDDRVSINQLWNRRHCTKFNGVSYIVQKGAESVFSEEGQLETQNLISYYMKNAELIRNTLKSLGWEVYGGENAPYIWFKVPGDLSSWDFFDVLLNKTSVVGTPGSGFGPSGEGYFRLSAFGSRETIEEALKRIQAIKI